MLHPVVVDRSAARVRDAHRVSTCLADLHLEAQMRLAHLDSRPLESLQNRLLRLVHFFNRVLHRSVLSRRLLVSEVHHVLIALLRLRLRVLDLPTQLVHFFRLLSIRSLHFITYSMFF